MVEDSSNEKKKKVKVVQIMNQELANICNDSIDSNQVCSTKIDFDKYTSSITGFENADSFSDFLKLISNPIRLKILLILLTKEWSCNCEFESVFNEHQTLISHHLRNLREGGLIKFRKQGQWKFYRIEPKFKVILEQLRDLSFILFK
ncbi:MAG: helix-turn-helix transcriptional regulator [Candidatus Heimdallarchaeota archaeon]|nr:helix-turn-helix transcriptional regulator [Candidatus Heimdallarchaeota archaeon]